MVKHYFHEGRRKEAFSLIELLVVIAIIGILASLLFPAITGARNRAQLAGCKGNLKNMANFAAAFESSAKFLPVTTRLVDNGSGGQVHVNHDTWMWEIYSDTGVTCPSQRYRELVNGKPPKGYGTNPQIMPNIYLGSNRSTVSLTDISRPHEVIMMADSAMIDSQRNGFSMSMAWYVGTGSTWGRESAANDPVHVNVIRWNEGNWWGDDPLMPRRHDGEAAMVFADGHVGTIRDYSEVKNRNYFAYFND